MRKTTLYKGIFMLIILLSASFSIKAQEKLGNLSTNPALVRYQQFRQAATPPQRLHKKDTIYVQKLPFFDDFSRTAIWPDDTLWLDNSVYINSSMAYLPPSIGVATFDGLNNQGTAYFPGFGSNTGQPADTLTSTWIDLSPYSDKDSLYLSFFYQPQGYGESPDANSGSSSGDGGGDSLVLELKPDTSYFRKNNIDTNKWIRVWSVAGSGVHPFRQVMIPIREKQDTSYFHGRFQFRFMNYGNLSGNLDHWHLDYVLLDRGRTKSDTAHEDVAVYYPSKPFVKRFTQMPYDDFLDELVNNRADSIFVFATNNSNKVKNVAFGYSISNAGNGNLIASEFNTQGDNLDIKEYRSFSLPISSLNNLPSSGDNVTFLIKTSVSNIPDDHRQNDTAYFYQHFNSLYAYDDGTAERSYGLENSKGQVALRFDVPKADSLYGVAIHFTYADADVSNKKFDLAVWSKISSPGTTHKDQPIATYTNLSPQYLPWMNGFHYFEFPDPLPITGTFYVGWIQNSNYGLNVGYDANYANFNGNKPNGNLFYDVEGKWRPTSLTGVPMIRANVGKRYVASIKDPAEGELIASVYPNPSQGTVNLSLPDNGTYHITLMDLQGRLLMQENGVRNNRTLNISDQPANIYLLKIISADGKKQVIKKIILN